MALRQGYPAVSQRHTSDAQIPLELETVARDYHDLDAECIHHRYVVRNRRENRILDRLPSDAKPAVRNMLRCILVRGTCMTSYAWAVEWPTCPGMWTTAVMPRHALMYGDECRNVVTKSPKSGSLHSSYIEQSRRPQGRRKPESRLDSAHKCSKGAGLTV